MACTIRAAARQSRKQIAELREFHLQATLTRMGARRKYIQNQLGTIDDFGVQLFFEVALLRGREVVIEDHQAGARAVDFGREFFHFALTNEGGCVRSGTRLNDAADDFRAGTGG